MYYNYKNIDDRYRSICEHVCVQQDLKFSKNCTNRLYASVIVTYRSCSNVQNSLVKTVAPKDNIFDGKFRLHHLKWRRKRYAKTSMLPKSCTRMCVRYWIEKNRNLLRHTPVVSNTQYANKHVGGSTRLFSVFRFGGQYLIRSQCQNYQYREFFPSIITYFMHRQTHGFSFLIMIDTFNFMKQLCRQS